MSRNYWGRDDGYEQNSLEAYRDFMVAPDGTYGHPSRDLGPRELSDGALERARAALTFSGPDTRFSNIMRRFSRFMAW